MKAPAAGRDPSASASRALKGSSPGSTSKSSRSTATRVFSVVDLGFGFASHGDDGFSSGVFFFQIPHGLGDLSERVGPVDDRCDLPGFDELLEDH